MSGFPTVRPMMAGHLPMGGDVAEVKTGVITFAEANVPATHGPTQWADLKAPSTWATIWFVVALVFLLKVL
jgi:hypothetical protein